MEPLQVDIVHFYPKENATAHHTVKYEVISGEETPTTTLVRRGTPFNGVIRFDRPYDPDSDVVQLVFNIGDKPTMDTQGSMFIKKDAISDKYRWTAKLVGVQADNSVSFQVSSPVNVPVGNWTLRVVTRLKNSPARQIYDYEQDIYILFNPWNPDDQTYMEDCSLLQEYVLNDVGKVWVGPLKTTRGKPWLYGQFDAVVLPACMFLLDQAQLSFNHRGDPVKMTRAISQIINSNDDGGCLVGRWDGQYEDGTAPSEWPGSVDILQQYLETQSEVPYGQCWVFAGVVTTVCRALGIPSRVVSNFVSAHDANSTLTVDKYYSEDMSELSFDPNNPQGGADSIWNYHVWNDVWMARPDLPPGFGGWQAIDATPQETSLGLYQCGPAPLEAIKQGMIGFSHDVEFMLASVNADLMRWRIDPESETGYSVVESDKYAIGQMVLTKKPFVFDPIGDEDRDNITNLYKHQEGTASERLALMNGVKYSPRAKQYYEVASNLNSDVKFSLRDIDQIDIGKPFHVLVDIENTSDEDRNIKAVLSAVSVFYNGVRADQVKKVEGKMRIGPKKSEQIRLNITETEYLPKLVEYGMMKISAQAIVDETKQAWADDDDFQVIKPNIKIEFKEDLVINQQATVSLSLQNPLNHGLNKCEFRLTSTGIAGRTFKVPAENPTAGGLVKAEVAVMPNKLGKINFVATFTSAELKDITGAANAEVFEG